jgi:hypothetical protein
LLFHATPLSYLKPSPSLLISSLLSALFTVTYVIATNQQLRQLEKHFIHSPITVFTLLDPLRVNILTPQLLLQKCTQSLTENSVKSYSLFLSSCFRTFVAILLSKVNLLFKLVFVPLQVIGVLPKWKTPALICLQCYILNSFDLKLHQMHCRVLFSCG